MEKGEKPQIRMPKRIHHNHHPASVGRTKSDHKMTAQSVSHPRAFLAHDSWKEAVKGLRLELELVERVERIRARIHDTVCQVCVDRGYDGTCYSLDPAGCVLNRMLPEIVQAISKTNSAYVRDYLDSIRERVCGACPNQDASKHCDVRDTANCGLDAYLPLVIDAVEAEMGLQ